MATLRQQAVEAAPTSVLKQAHDSEQKKMMAVLNANLPGDVRCSVAEMVSKCILRFKLYELRELHRLREEADDRYSGDNLHGAIWMVYFVLTQTK